MEVFVKYDMQIKKLNKPIKKTRSYSTYVTCQNIAIYIVAEEKLINNSDD